MPRKAGHRGLVEKTKSQRQRLGRKKESLKQRARNEAMKRSYG